jgi:uncharacterized membrane protein YhaH (DUF805 family)
VTAACRADRDPANLGSATVDRAPMSDVTSPKSHTPPNAAWAWIYAPAGRAGRADFFYALLARVFALYLLSLLIAIIADSAGWMVSDNIFNDLYRIPMFLVAFVASAGGPLVRRLHDIDRSGWHSIWLCLALILGEIFVRSQRGNIAVVIIAAIPFILASALMVWPGTKGPNRYGPPPA